MQNTFAPDVINDSSRRELQTQHLDKIIFINLGREFGLFVGASIKSSESLCLTSSLKKQKQESIEILKQN